MAALVAATHVLGTATPQQTWIPATRAGMTTEGGGKGAVIPGLAFGAPE
ncbi:hypothetical protein [Microvirga zambiensis]|nr:hypothetical protein [Microvirga zambiensis]